MNVQAYTPALLFDTLDWARIERQIRETNRDKSSQCSREEHLYCTACRNPITRHDQRVSIQGEHEHLFSNPHGFTFRIGCFAFAPGCAHQGERTEQWTWFQGYSWQIAVCARCRIHLGWRYTGADGAGFHGLILSHLVTEDGTH